MIEKLGIVSDEYIIDNKLQLVYLNFKDGELKVFFEQTMSKLQWVYNFMFFPFLFRKAYKNMDEKFYVHMGFHKCYHAVRDELIQFVKENFTDIYKIQIYGASHGCSAALAFTEDLIFNKLTDAMIECNFGGSPKWMTKKAEKVIRERIAFKTSTTEWEQGSDIANKVAPFYTQYKTIKHLGQKRKWYIWSVKDHKDICVLIRSTFYGQK